MSETNLGYEGNNVSLGLQSKENEVSLKGKRVGLLNRKGLC